MEDSQQGETRTESVSRRTRSRASLEISSPSRVSFSSPVVNVDCGEPASKRQRSKVWETMQKVMINNEEVAICRICESHLSAKSSNGTTHLRAHVNRCLAKKDKENSEGNQQFDQAKSRNDLAEMIILHEYPLSIVDHTGFRRYSFGLQPNFKMVSRNTIKKDILAIYDRERANAIDLIQRSGSRVAITTDMWTAKPTKRGFMAVTAHYIDKSWVLQSKLLRFVYVPAPHNQEVISDVLVDTLMEWGLDARLSTVTVDNATTNDAVMSSILEKLPTHSQMLDGKFVHMRCCAHILNLIVKEGLKVVEGGIRRIRDSCYYWSSSPSRKEKFEEMAKSMKVQCSRSLALDVKTRWNSTYFMLQSALPYREVFTRLKRGERGYDCLPTGEDWFLAHELLGKLKLFNTVTELFSGTKYITANSYFPKVCQIKVALTSWLDSPIEIVRVMASKMLEKYDKYWNECHDIK